MEWLKMMVFLMSGTPSSVSGGLPAAAVGARASWQYWFMSMPHSRGCCSRTWGDQPRGGRRSASVARSGLVCLGGCYCRWWSVPAGGLHTWPRMPVRAARGSAPCTYTLPAWTPSGCSHAAQIEIGLAAARAHYLNSSCGARLACCGGRASSPEPATT
eukprot:scaffold2131_cov384-Prasinococcus_capsulatus_cf.AAC.21